MLLVVIFLLSACSRATWVPIASLDGLPPSVLPSDSAYVWPTEQPDIVAPGAVVTITSLDQSLNGAYRVDINGILKLPHAKSLSTEGLDARNVESKIHDLYRGYFKSPQDLGVKITTKGVLIDVQGLVAKPGQYSVAGFTSLDEIIALVGGLQDRGGTQKVQFLQIRGRYGSGIIALAEYHSGRSSVAPQWRGGERLFFQTSAGGATEGAIPVANSVRVIGQVKNPAEYTAMPDSTFFSYLLQAGGPTDRADLAHITLIRGVGTQSRARNFNSHDFDDIPPIEPGDTILVNADVTSPVEKSTRVAASIAGVLTSLSMLAIAAL